MSKAARKARKQEQRETGTKYQHPSREGVPYGHSKQPNLADELAAMERRVGIVQAMMKHPRVTGFADGGFR